MSDGVKVQTQLRELVAEEVRALLARRRLNGAKLAAAIERSEMYVSRRLRGETAFDLDDLQHIAETLGVPVADLLPAEMRTGRSTIGYPKIRIDRTTRPKGRVTTRRDRPKTARIPRRPVLLARV